MDIIEVLSDSLQIIAWKMVGAMVIAAVLAMIYKLIEKKILAFIERKIYERKQKKLEEQTASKQIQIKRSEPTYEEWKASRENEKR